MPKVDLNHMGDLGEAMEIDELESLSSEKMRPVGIRKMKRENR